MKVMTILGTRPEIIRLSLIIKKLDQRLNKNHVLVHTGQNYDKNLSDIFFDEMKIRQPNYYIHSKSSSFGEQIGFMFSEVDRILNQEKPDRILILGDTNSALCAILGERRKIPVYHMEAGNRCFDINVPEEMNRKIVDSISSVNMPYTLFSRENLLREGIHQNRIWTTGNPIFEVLSFYKDEINQSSILKDLELNEGKYFLVTTHRAENVDDQERLTQIIQSLNSIATKYGIPIICSMHPRTADRMTEFNLSSTHPFIYLKDPFGFFDFIKLQKHASCVLTDSGTVQEESCLFHVPAVTIRESTERAETVLCGSNVVSGLNKTQILQAVDIMIHSDRKWNFPEGYKDSNVSAKVINMLLGGTNHV